jgi:hypothetical protein
VRATWHTDEGEVRFSVGNEEHVVQLDQDGSLSSQAVERGLWTLHSADWLENRGRLLMKRAMEALSDPGTDARIPANEEKKGSRQALVLHGWAALKDPSKAKNALLRDVSELGCYLIARKSVETDDEVFFELTVAGETKIATAEWYGEEGDVRVSIGDTTRVVRMEEDGSLSSHVFEEALAQLLLALGEMDNTPSGQLGVAILARCHLLPEIRRASPLTPVGEIPARGPEETNHIGGKTVLWKGLPVRPSLAGGSVGRRYISGGLGPSPCRRCDAHWFRLVL